MLYPTDVPYARLLHDHLAVAGIATNGPGVESLRNRAVADAFLRLLALDPDNLERVAVFRLARARPYPNGGRECGAANPLGTRVPRGGCHAWRLGNEALGASSDASGALGSRS